PDQGSTFWVELELERPAGHPTVGATPPAFAEVRVLVVDDVAPNRRALCEQLRAWGCVADEAASGAAALDALRAAAEPYRLVLVDRQMPDGDGEAVARAIAADSRIGPTSFVLLSPIGSPGTSAELRARGFAAVLTKPVRQAHLLDVVSTLAGD